MTSFMAASSDPVAIEARLHAGAVAFERAVLADGVRALEDPVLPGRQAAEDLGLHGLGAGEAQIGLHGRQGVGREARALFEHDADLVVPIHVVEREGHEPAGLGLLAFEWGPDPAARRREALWLAQEPGLEPAEAVAHRIGAEIEGAERERRGWPVVAL